jgi:serine protease AprX
MAGFLRRTLSAFTAVALGAAAVLSLGCGTSSSKSTQTTASISQAPAWVDPAVRAGSVDGVSVIVTAKSGASATATVERAGGRVTSDLRIINAAGAIVSRDAIERLAIDPEVASVIENKRVQSASEWNGWVSHHRVFRGFYQTAAAISAAATHLPEGGFVGVASNGEVIIANTDGTERKRLSITGSPHNLAPVVAGDGKIYIAGSAKTLAAIDPAGRILWENTSMRQAGGYAANVVTDGTNAYTLDVEGTVYAFDGATGTILWQNTLPKRGRTQFLATPAITADGTLLVTSDAGDVFAVNSAGIRWRSDAGAPILRAPVLRGTTAYVIAGSRLIAYDMATGATLLNFTAPEAILGDVVFTATAMYVTTPSRLYSLTTAGAVRWTASSTGNVFTEPPLVTADGTLVYGIVNAAKGKRVGSIHGFDAASGAMKWTYTGFAELTIRPSVDPEGGILFADKATSWYRLAPDGTETHRLKVHSTITDLSQASDTGSMIVRVETNYLVFLGRLPNQWNGKPDVEKTDTRGVFRLVNPVVVDIGADDLHKRTHNGNWLRGMDVGVAVIDSGVYWDAETKMILSTRLQHQFMGQADFIQTTCIAGIQKSDHCFTDFNNSLDGYGHGTHVAGSIANKLTEERTGTFLGVAPDARILSARVLGNDGTGSYETVIKGIQWVVDNRAAYNVKVMNLSLSAYATVPYFVDPLNRAVEKAWLAGITVVAAAGNTGPHASTITVPGNDPYVITVGAVSSNRTPGYWRDDVVPMWSATGPTHDGFAKPDVIAPGSQIVSYMYNDPTGVNTPMLARLHPDYAATATLFRMNGTSMATAITSGVVALMLQVNPALTPDQVKYRLMATARLSIDTRKEPVFNTFQQGMGRIWAPDAVLDAVDPLGRANLDMDLAQDLAHGYETEEDLSYHYQGPVRQMTSDDGTAYLYYATDTSGESYALGGTTSDGRWLDAEAVARMSWAGARMSWAGGISWSGDAESFAVARMSWAGARMSWAGARMSWAGARMSWAGARMSWAGGHSWTGGATWGVARMSWAGNADAYSVARMSWAGSLGRINGSSFTWIDDKWAPPPGKSVPPPAGVNP